MTIVTQLQQQVQVTQAENQTLRERMMNFEAVQAQSPTASAAGFQAQEVLHALRGLPQALERLSRPKGLFDPKGLGKPQVLGDEAAEQRFRVWAVKVEDYVFGVYGGRSREVLEWAASADSEITNEEIANSYGSNADLWTSGTRFMTLTARCTACSERPPRASPLTSSRTWQLVLAWTHGDVCIVGSTQQPAAGRGSCSMH